MIPAKNKNDKAMGRGDEGSETPICKRAAPGSNDMDRMSLKRIIGA